MRCHVRIFNTIQVFIWEKKGCKVRRKCNLKGASWSLQPVVSVCNCLLPSFFPDPAVPSQQVPVGLPSYGARLCGLPLASSVHRSLLLYSLRVSSPESTLALVCPLLLRALETRRRFVATAQVLNYLRRGRCGGCRRGQGGTVLPQRGGLQRAAAAKQVKF